MEAAAARVAGFRCKSGRGGVDDAVDEASFAQKRARVTEYERMCMPKQSDRPRHSMCGRAGRRHTPEVCYHGAGYELHGPPSTFALPTESAQQFWTSRFDKRVGRPSRLRLYWGWNSHGTWEAATSPRWHFRGEPFLYKLYVSHEIANPTAEVDPTPEFLRAFVPVIQKVCFHVGREPHAIVPKRARLEYSGMSCSSSRIRCRRKTPR